MKEVGTYFITPSRKLYFIEALMPNGNYVIENCKTGQFIIWSKAQLLHRRMEIITPKEGGEQ